MFSTPLLALQANRKVLLDQIVYRWGGYTLDSANRRFTRDGNEYDLEPKVFAVLIQLVARPACPGGRRRPADPHPNGARCRLSIRSALGPRQYEAATNAGAQMRQEDVVNEAADQLREFGGSANCIL